VLFWQSCCKLVLDLASGLFAGVQQASGCLREPPEASGNLEASLRRSLIRAHVPLRTSLFIVFLHLPRGHVPQSGLPGTGLPDPGTPGLRFTFVLCIGTPTMWGIGVAPSLLSFRVSARALSGGCPDRQRAGWRVPSRGSRDLVRSACDVRAVGASC
jgi:hypothetical protein